MLCTASTVVKCRQFMLESGHFVLHVSAPYDDATEWVQAVGCMQYHDQHAHHCDKAVAAWLCFSGCHLLNGIISSCSNTQTCIGVCCRLAAPGMLDTPTVGMSWLTPTSTSSPTACKCFQHRALSMSARPRKYPALHNHHPVLAVSSSDVVAPGCSSMQ